MKKCFKEVDKLYLIGIVLGIIECSLITTFLILCREWTNYSGGLFVYVVVCIFDIIIGSGLILCICFEILQLIENKKQNKNNKNNTKQDN